MWLLSFLRSDAEPPFLIPVCAVDGAPPVGEWWSGFSVQVRQVVTQSAVSQARAGAGLSTRR